MAAKILVATDFSEPAREALRQARAIAARDHAILGVCYVMPRPLHANANPERVEARGRSVLDLEGHAREGLEASVRELRKDGWSHVDTFVVVSTHGRSGLSRALLGSVAERIVRHAHSPVLVVRGNSESRL